MVKKPFIIMRQFQYVWQAVASVLAAVANPILCHNKIAIRIWKYSAVYSFETTYLHFTFKKNHKQMAFQFIDSVHS